MFVLVSLASFLFLLNFAGNAYERSTLKLVLCTLSNGENVITLLMILAVMARVVLVVEVAESPEGAGSTSVVVA